MVRPARRTQALRFVSAAGANTVVRGCLLALPVPLPAAAASAPARRPAASVALLVYLHGGRSDGDNPWELLPAHHQRKGVPGSPPALCESSSLADDLAVLSPQTTSDFLTDAALDQLLELVVAVCRRHVEIDTRRIVVTGASGGGGASMALAMRHPSLLAGAAPVAGWGPETDEEAAPLASLPVYVSHNERDKVVNIRNADDMVAALRAAGNTSVTYNRLQREAIKQRDSFHDAWTATYTDQRFWQWVHRQRCQQALDFATLPDAFQHGKLVPFRRLVLPCSLL